MSSEVIAETNIKKFYIAVSLIAKFWLLTYDIWVISHGIGFDSVGGDYEASKWSVIDLSSIWPGTAVVKYWRTLTYILHELPATWSAA